MSATRSALLRRLPIPSCDDLMTAVANGQPACDALAARFAPWGLADAVPQIVMNALDPLLVETVLGPVHSRRWLPLLREHYRQVKHSYPGDFADVEASWRQQRAWWMQFTEPAEEDSSGGGKGALDRADPVAAETPHRRSPPPSAADRLPKRSSAPAGPVGVAGGANQAATTAEPVAHPPMAGPEDPAERVDDMPPPPARPAPSAPSPPRSTTVRPPSAQQAVAPARRSASARSGSSRVPAPARPAPTSKPPARPAVVSRASQAVPGRAASVAWTGKVSPGARGRQLVEAAGQSLAAVRAHQLAWAQQTGPAPVSDWHSWSLPSTLLQGTARDRDRGSPVR